MELGVDNDLDFATQLEEYYFYQLGSSTVRKRVPNVHERQVSARDAVASGGAYTTRDVTLRVPVSAFDLFSPEVGGLCEHVHRGELYYVIQTLTAVNRTRWKLICRRSAVSSQGLTSRVTIQQAKYERDDDQSPSIIWRNLAANVPAAIEEIKSVNVVTNDRRFVRIEYRLYVETDLDLQANMRITSEGQTYNVVSVSGKGVLGNLVVCDAVRPSGPQAG